MPLRNQSDKKTLPPLPPINPRQGGAKGKYSPNKGNKEAALTFAPQVPKIKNPKNKPRDKTIDPVPEWLESDNDHLSAEIRHFKSDGMKPKHLDPDYDNNAHYNIEDY